uniref:ATP synthase complex subunit 8 n=1 Tax=Iconaster longimanus TaxID=2672156 RepID=A0A7S8CUJ7_9ECHI|nr:ATP synthase F0 subunit 8 [Iconaster longimanus]QPC56399.1 ATP synthase F0 subunit 8 [Iconaster longimanus]
MPQLNLAWWLFNFLLSWVSITLIFTILVNKNLVNKNILFPQNPSNNPQNNHQWPWN